jgi:alkanesulfonate monooxygenase SsuD/methylene tetrahydromethanopterin reductase-like flavin-dependent oxidoreductase (luciferase family)
MCCPTNNEAIAKGVSGAQMFGFLLGRGQRNYGRDHFHRQFASLSEGERMTQYARRQGLQVVDEEPEDESIRALYRASRRGGFIGSPEFIRETIRKYEAAHIDLLLFIAQCGNRRHEDIMASLELFAKDVMPEFQQRHPQHQKWREQQLDGVAFPVNATI